MTLPDYFTQGWVWALYAFAGLVGIRILLENRTPAKTTGYLITLLLFPAAGLFIYFFFGGAIRRRRRIRFKKAGDQEFYQSKAREIWKTSRKNLLLFRKKMGPFRKLAYLMLRDELFALSAANKVQLLINGETKFPVLLQKIKEARHHIHLEYYILENDVIGNELATLLAQKSKEGVLVRLLYDDFGAQSFARTLKTMLRESGVDIRPFYRTYWGGRAYRINHRNHRKIVVIDGKIGFVGGINISDKYTNTPGQENQKIYWRDTHLLLEGPCVNYLQNLFLLDWKFASRKNLLAEPQWFGTRKYKSNQLVQVIASGPDQLRPSILMAYLQAIYSAHKRCYITTPYLIPDEALVLALQQAALRGVDVRILVPDYSDSKIVNAAARSYYETLLSCGVKIYVYERGFIHAKSMLVDELLSIVGTANMDLRSFTLNFEVSALVYDSLTNQQLSENFESDFKDSRILHLEQWRQRPSYIKLGESIARLLAPLL